MSLGHRMAVRQVEGAADIEVTSEADVRRLEGVDDQGGVATGRDMEVAGPMTGFAADVDRVGAAGLQTRVAGGGKIADQVLVAIGAGAGADKGSSWYGWGHHHRAGERGAREENGR
jgi:hypothetical protein